MFAVKNLNFPAGNLCSQGMVAVSRHPNRMAAGQETQEPVEMLSAPSLQDSLEINSNIIWPQVLNHFAGGGTTFLGKPWGILSPSLLFSAPRLPWQTGF